MPLENRVYQCPECGLAIDRDKNAAINIVRSARPKFVVGGKPVDTQALAAGFNDSSETGVERPHKRKEAGSKRQTLRE